jgi:hypothetical protein
LNALLHAAETRDDVWRAARPYDGPTTLAAKPPDLAGKVMCGYQGWFATEGDGGGRGWRHYAGRSGFKPGSCSIDLWPDVSELAADERFATPFRHADGRVAEVFSSTNRKTVLRHFEWMREYGIDGVFVQRFGVETVHPPDLRHCNTVLTHCREGANRNGRAYAVMYDLSGLRAGGTRAVIDDWKELVDRMRVGRDDADRAYLNHNGKPLVAVWGIGFNDGRRYTLDECERLIDFLKTDPKYGGFSVMVGVPTGFRTLDGDSVKDEALHRIAAKADIVSPWTVGRYRTLDGIDDHAKRRWQPDLAWCRERKIAYLPVVFPGFSWRNMHPRAPFDEIPRQKGEFLWRQFVAAKRAGAEAIYVAMFDELDEGTAIFKCISDVPTGASRFVTFGGLPSDHYLWLTGMGRKMLAGDIPETNAAPARTGTGSRHR